MAQSRSRPAPPVSSFISAEEAALAPLPQAASLPELRAAMGSPGVIQAEVDALLGALARPPTGDETPRARADYLLSLLELPEEAAERTGSDGRTVRTAAVEALLELGYPYALEVPPEVLERVRRERPYSGSGTRRAGSGGHLPGVAVTVLSFLAQFFLLAIAPLRVPSTSQESLLVTLMGLICIPPLLAFVGLGAKVRQLQWLGSRGMLLQGLGWLGVCLLPAWSMYGTTVSEALLLPWYLPLLAGYLMSPKPEAGATPPSASKPLPPVPPA